MIATVCDGLKVIEESKEQSVDLLVFDVDQKDPSLPLRCPPQSFVQKNILENGKRLLTPTGIMG